MDREKIINKLLDGGKLLPVMTEFEAAEVVDTVIKNYNKKEDGEKNLVEIFNELGWSQKTDFGDYPKFEDTCLKRFHYKGRSLYSSHMRRFISTQQLDETLELLSPYEETEPGLVQYMHDYLIANDLYSYEDKEEFKKKICELIDNNYFSIYRDNNIV